MALYSSKRANSSGKYNASKYLCTQLRSTQIWKRKIARPKEREIDCNTLIVGDLNIPFSLLDNQPEKMSKEIQDLNHTIIEGDLTDIYRTSTQSHKTHIFLSPTWYLLKD